MIPWPAKLLDLYPFPAAELVATFGEIVRDRDPLRPWWFVEPTAIKPCWRRTDRREVLFYQDGWHGRISIAKLAEQRIEVDKDHPLPHPGFRVGQVWADEDGNATQITAKWTDGSGPIASLIIGSGPISAPTLRENYYFLVHDAVCPWLAPWAPAEAA